MRLRRTAWTVIVEAMVPRPPACQGCTQECGLFISLVAGGKAAHFACCRSCPTVQQPVGGGVLPSWALGIALAVPNPLGRSRCPTCGFRWQDFERLHRLGCPTCYEAHQAEAMATIARLQPGTDHQGRRPQASPAERRARLDKAQADLQAAIAEEDFEAAAGLRDLIRELQTGLGELQP